MARRRRKSFNGGLILAAGTAASVMWLWSQWWGQALLLSLAAVAVGGVIAALATASRRRRRRRYRLATMEGLLELTPREFEDAVAELLRTWGFSSVSVSGGAGDLQADILATDPDGLTTVVQCKRYAPSRTIGSPVIQSFIGMARVHHECDRALFVTTGSFTTPAQLLADEHGIELIDGAELVDLFTRRTVVTA